MSRDREAYVCLLVICLTEKENTGFDILETDDWPDIPVEVRIVNVGTLTV